MSAPYAWLKGESVCSMLGLVDGICARAPREFWTGEPSLTTGEESLIEAIMVEVDARETGA